MNFAKFSGFNELFFGTMTLPQFVNNNWMIASVVISIRVFGPFLGKVGKEFAINFR